jgi:hypothetical protein
MAIDPLAPAKFGLRLGIGVLRFELRLIERALGLAEPEPEAAVVVVEDEPEVKPFEPVAFPEPLVHEPVPEPEPEPPAHIDTEPEPVAEFAEPGAEEGAGAEVHVDEPWGGYARMKAADVLDRVAVAGAAEVAVIQLYEMTHRKRSSVLDAVARRERELANAPAR